MKDFSDIAIIIPAYHPNQNLLHLVNELHQVCQSPIMVIDDGNQDQTIFQALKNVTILHHPKNQGKGSALKTAFQHVIQQHPKLLGVVTADADGQHAVSDILKMVQLLDKDDRVFFLATRTFDKKTPLRNRLGNLITRFVFRIVTKVLVLDTQNGLRGIPTWMLTDLITVPGQRYEYEMAMLKHIATKNITIIQVPTETIYGQKDAVSSFHPLRDSVLIYRTLLQPFMRYLMTGILSFVIDYGLFIWFFSLLSHPWKAIIAVTSARVISGILNYLMNRFYTFKADVRWVKSSGQYLLLFLIILAASAVFTDMLIYLGLPHPLAKVLVDSILFIISFQVQKRWIFSI